MTRRFVSITAEEVELLDDAALELQELARCCRVSPNWIAARVEAGVLQPIRGTSRSQWRFDSRTLVRVRRIVHLEQTWDADPQLAALTADLIEEVARLRRQLGQS
ncbi:MAG: chaperone modulator CbpM [Ottowia sp.]|nr:chaperone modulator CbpM [Ottowia sp.]